MCVYIYTYIHTPKIEKKNKTSEGTKNTRIKYFEEREKKKDIYNKTKLKSKYIK